MEVGGLALPVSLLLFTWVSLDLLGLQNKYDYIGCKSMINGTLTVTPVTACVSNGQTL